MNSSTYSQKHAIYFGLAAVLCWSTVATAFKISLIYVSPLQLILVAATTSCVFLFLLLLFAGRLREVIDQPRGVYLNSFLFAALNPCLYYALLFWAYQLLPAQEAQAINYSWAIVMTFMAVPLLGQKLHWFDYLAAAFCYLGVCIIATKGQLLSLEFENGLGVLLALLSTLVWSAYWIFSQKDSREPLLGLFLNFLFALPILYIVAYCSGELALGQLPWQGWASSVYVGLFEMGLAFIFWLAAMNRAENTASLANLIFISPFLSLLLIAVFLNEAILPSTVLGLMFIIVGLVAQQRFSQASLAISK